MQGKQKEFIISQFRNVGTPMMAKGEEKEPETKRPGKDKMLTTQRSLIAVHNLARGRLRTRRRRGV